MVITWVGIEGVTAINRIPICSTGFDNAMYRSIALPIILLSLSGCATPIGGYQTGVVSVVLQDQVGKCSYLDTVIGSSSWYGLFVDKGIENARAYALGKAEALGATHVVWETIDPVHGTTQIAAQAYRCPVTTKSG